MELLRTEVKLLLLRNQQLENENYVFKCHQKNVNICIANEIKLNKVLENMKVAQNEYISKLNDLLIELTQHNPNANPNRTAEDHYLLLKRDIEKCIGVCQHLQTDYEKCKRLSQQSRLQSQSHSRSHSPIHSPIHSNRDKDNKNSLTAKLSQIEFEEQNENNGSDGEVLQVIDDMEDVEEDNEDNIDNDNNVDNEENEDNEDSDDSDDNDNNESDGECLLDDEDHVLDAEEDDSDSDPNGAGEQYIDLNDKEFIPKRSLPKSARKSFNITMSSKLTKAAKKGYKSSQKFGDKFRCNWKGCNFISSYKQNVERHYRVHTGERPFKCMFKGCGFSASQAGNLKVHQQRHGHQCGSTKMRAKSSNSQSSKSHKSGK